MSNREVKSNKKDILEIAFIILLCAAMAVLEFVPIRYTEDEIKNGLISDAVPLLVGAVAVICLMLRGKTGLFGKPEKLLFALPCFLIAINNFPFPAYFAGGAKLVHAQPSELFWFALYCAGVGVFEECVFRGILFPLMAGYFSADRKGFLKTFFLSSVVFGAMHLFNVFFGAGIGPTVLQVGYSTLIGGLCAFALIKTKNILFPALIHGIYDFCGLLIGRLGEGGADWQTYVVWAVVGVIVGVFVLCNVWKYPEEERIKLYRKLGFGGVASKKSEEENKIEENSSENDGNNI